MLTSLLALAENTSFGTQQQAIKKEETKLNLEMLSNIYPTDDDGFMDFIKVSHYNKGLYPFAVFL